MFVCKSYLSKILVCIVFFFCGFHLSTKHVCFMFLEYVISVGSLLLLICCYFVVLAFAEQPSFSPNLFLRLDSLSRFYSLFVLFLFFSFCLLFSFFGGVFCVMFYLYSVVLLLLLILACINLVAPYLKSQVSDNHSLTVL